MQEHGREETFPSLKELLCGPFVKKQGGWEVNKSFVHLLFLVMPCIVSKNVWEGKVTPAYMVERNERRFDRLVSRSDGGLVLWVLDNYWNYLCFKVDSAQLVCTEGGRPADKARWTSGCRDGATKQFGGWSDEGKSAFNTYVGTWKSHWMDPSKRATGLDGPSLQDQEKFMIFFDSEWNLRFDVHKYSKSDDGEEDGVVPPPTVIIADDDL